jgi:hypothetical protein
MNATEERTTLNTPGQESQGFSYELHASSPVLIGEENLNNKSKQPKKKTCRGNRKAQRSRRRERRRQQIMNNNDTNHVDQDIIITDDHIDDPTENEQKQIQVIHLTRIE